MRQEKAGGRTPAPLASPAGAPDWGLLVAVAGLLAFGLVMVYSSSFYWAERLKSDQLDMLKRELLWAGLGAVLMLGLMHVHPRRWAGLLKLGLPAALLLLAAVLIPGIGLQLNGARRWLGMGSATFQPAEVVKVVLVVFLANLLDRRAARLKSLGAVTFPALLVTGLCCVLIVAQPNLSTALIIAGTAFAILVVGEIPFLYLAGLLAAVVPLFGYLAFSKGYRAGRMVSFLNPLARPGDEGYQISQGLYAIGSGGLFGEGLGQGKAKFGWLPEGYNDMIFAVITEELGFLGAAAVLGLFTLFVWRGYKIAAEAPDRYMRLLAFGLTTLVAIQVVLNVGVVTAAIPPTGVPLPFVSYGGSSLTVLMASVGILLSVSRYRAAAAPTPKEVRTAHASYPR